MKKKLPTFLGIGAQKSGTTWLHEMLRQHPSLWLPRERKELMFFDEKRNFEKGLGEYASYFNGVNNQTEIGEITPGYLWVSDYKKDTYKFDNFRLLTPIRAQQTLGDNVKLLVLLRNPVERAISAFFHHRFKGRFKGKTFRDCWSQGGIVHMGFYSRHLDVWHQAFPKDNFHIRTYDEMTNNQQTYLDSVCDFLEIPIFTPNNPSKRYQKKFDYVRKNDGVYVQGPSGEEKWINLEEIQELSEIYREDILRLSDRYKVDTSEWR